jgi:hypothetical protein
MRSEHERLIDRSRWRGNASAREPRTGDEEGRAGRVPHIYLEGDALPRSQLLRVREPVREQPPRPVEALYADHDAADGLAGRVADHADHSTRERARLGHHEVADRLVLATRVGAASASRRLDRVAFRRPRTGCAVEGRCAVTEASTRCSFCGKRPGRHRRLFYPSQRAGASPTSDAAICVQCVREFWARINARPDLYGISREPPMEEEATYQDERDERSWRRGKTK